MEEGRGADTLPDRLSMVSKKRHVHFVGIGGMGMSGIAELLVNLGYTVSGSDLAETETTRRLALGGATIAYSHRPDHITADVDVVVISSAVKYANPEVVRARELRIPVIPRAEMLAELMRMKEGVAVAGTHGKTTTTSLVAAVLSRSGLDPTVVIGGKLKALDSNAHLGHGRFLVAEADESDGTFLLLTPVIAVVTNIDAEHLDYYGTMDRVTEAYLQFINRVPFYGVAVLCLDSLPLRSLLPHVRKPYVTYGLTPDADFMVANLSLRGLETTWEVHRKGKFLGRLCLSLPGSHYALNATAAVAVAWELEIPFATVQQAVSEFSGIHRRFEIKGEARGVTVVDDYAHHPEEIRATLRAARAAFGRRLVVVFQPHRFTRTRDLFSHFLRAFDDADMVFLTDIYPAGEEHIAGVSAEELFRTMKREGRTVVSYVPAKEDIPQLLCREVRAGDVIITVGAGDISQVGEKFFSLWGP